MRIANIIMITFFLLLTSFVLNSTIVLEIISAGICPSDTPATKKTNLDELFVDFLKQIGPKREECLVRTVFAEMLFLSKRLRNK